MATPTIDYDALAAKHGAAAPAVDYDALAAKHNGTNSAPPAPAPPQENGVQQEFDKLSEIQPHHMPTSLKDLGGEALKGIGNIGAGGIGLLSPMFHPIESAKSLIRTEANPIGDIGTAKNLAVHPLEAAESLVGGAGAAGLGDLAIRGVGSAIPSKARAGATLEDIRNQAANVPVTPTEAMPKLARFQELTQRGGSTAKPATQLSNRLRSIMVPTSNTQPFNFPEARDFYSNISAQSAEDASRLNPIMRRQMGDVRSGLHQDLTNAAEQVGRGKDYSDAIREYARAAQLRKGLTIAAKWAVPFAVGGGLVGKLVNSGIPK